MILRHTVAVLVIALAGCATSDAPPTQGKGAFVGAPLSPRWRDNAEFSAARVESGRN